MSSNMKRIYATVNLLKQNQLEKKGFKKIAVQAKQSSAMLLKPHIIILILSEKFQIQDVHLYFSPLMLTEVKKFVNVKGRYTLETWNL